MCERKIRGIALWGNAYHFDGVVEGRLFWEIDFGKWPEDHVGTVGVSREEKYWQREKLEPRPWCGCRRGGGRRGRAEWGGTGSPVPLSLTTPRPVLDVSGLFRQERAGPQIEPKKLGSYAHLLTFVQLFIRFLMYSEFSAPWRMNSNGV